MGQGGSFAPPQEGSQAVDDQARDEAWGSLTADRGSERAGRLARTDDVRRVLESGRRRRLGLIDVVWRRSEAGHLRLGLIVPKFQSTAVARNRLRRWLRELVRRRACELGALDVVVRARRSAYGGSFADLRADVAAWVDELGGTR